MRSRIVGFAAALITAASLTACSSGSPEVTVPAPPDSGAGAQQPSNNPPPRPPQPPTSPNPNPPPAYPEKCDHREAQWAIGESRSDQLLERARVAAGAEFARFLRLGDPVTLEYRIGRLNLGLDDQGIVRTVQCW